MEASLKYFLIQTLALSTLLLMISIIIIYDTTVKIITIINNAQTKK